MAEENSGLSHVRLKSVFNDPKDCSFVNFDFLPERPIKIEEKSILEFFRSIFSRWTSMSLQKVTKYLMAQRKSILSSAYICVERTSSIKFTISPLLYQVKCVETAIILIPGLCLSKRQN